MYSLRWFCQMCQKQCRDENGFKNHCTTENHLRQMERYSTDANKYTEGFSRDFEKAFLDVLSHHHHTKRMNANYVYNEMIQDKNHVHMNATRWDNLASFVQHLGGTGKCVIDETERGWFVKWIDPEEKRRELERRKREEEESRTLEMRTKALLKRQKEVAEQQQQDDEEEVAENEPVVHEEEQRVVVVGKKTKLSGPSAVFTDKEEEEEIVETKAAAELDDAPTTWLMPDIVVKIVSNKVGPDLKNEKAVVSDVHDDEDTADLIILKSGLDVHRVPSKRLETVIPKIGGRVVILGKCPTRGLIGTIEALKPDDCTASVKLPNGQVHEFDFEEISKSFEDSD